MFNYNSERAKEARLGGELKKPLVQTLLWLLVLGGIIGFLIFIFVLKNSLGWTFLIFTIFAMMILIWQKKRLLNVPIGKTMELNDVLASDVLALMPKDPTPKKLAEFLYRTRGGCFMALRFGLVQELLLNVAEYLGDDIKPIFTKAMEIQRKTESRYVGGAVLSVAIIESFENHEYLLKQMKLELTDLYNGILWYNDLNDFSVELKKKHRNGGIARDLSFGYIPVLGRFGQNISAGMTGSLVTRLHQPEQQEILDKMMEALSTNGRKNVALVGAEGSGKSTIVNAFAERLMNAEMKVPKDLKFRQIFILDAARLISAASGRGEMENLMHQIMGEAYAAKNIIICLDKAELFFEDGTGSVNISAMLLPILEAGRLPVILMMDEKWYLKIADQNSTLANALNKIMVPESDYNWTMRVLEDQVPLLEYKYKVFYTYRSLSEAYRLGKRYVYDLVMPGQALNLLENAARFADKNKFVTEESINECIEKTAGVKVKVADDMDSREKLLNLENLIHERMIDQNEAVSAVSNALRRAGAGVRNENRPIGTFLFMGPTGVGKTELAKSLAAVYFGDESKMVRLDMNEYVTSDDVSRLIADGASDPNGLVAQVMKKPFSVVLLDEIEKAHDLVLTTLLQLLDEGVLRDVKNREVSFKDTIVICTTNAKDLSEFKPEFVNRFDEICHFHELSSDDLLKVVGLIIDSVNKTLAEQKISVSIDEDARRLLVERGYDPQMGARPMRRIVQKTVENIVAKMVLSGAVDSGANVIITKEMLEAELN